MKRLLGLALVTVLILTPVSSVRAELVDSEGSEYGDESKGKDTTQGKTTTYTDVPITETEVSKTSEVTVYATRGSSVQYKIPQVIIGSAGGSASYKVGVKGDLSSRQTVSIAPPSEFQMTDGTRSVTATISQPKTSWTYLDLDGVDDTVDDDGFTIGVGNISFSIPAGSFSGTFNFDITVSQS